MMESFTEEIGNMVLEMVKGIKYILMIQNMMVSEKMIKGMDEAHFYGMMVINI